MARKILGIMISGGSCVGKTTLSLKLAQTIGWNVTSTDMLARHPGRPWPNIRPQVAEYYSQLSLETIYWFLRLHHENMWPGIQQKINADISVQNPFIIEGTALRPEYIAPLISEKLLGIYLSANEEFLQERMRSEAKYSQCDESKRCIINKFINRSLRDNFEMHVAALKHGIRIIDVSDERVVTGVLDDLVQKMLSQGSQNF